MAGMNVPYDRSTLQPPIAGDQIPLATRRCSDWRAAWATRSPSASVLGMFLYFLLLGSVAVVVVTEQFPWFALGPVTILLTVAYFRHLDAKEARRSSQDKGIPQ